MRGKGDLKGFSNALDRDHPRVCGEKEIHISVSGKVIGSPPRVRGKDHSQLPTHLVSGIPPRVRGKASNTSVSAVLARITPACAGKSFSFILKTSKIKDHPRVCGEKIFRIYI